MYVRNYGVPPKSVKNGDASPGLIITPTPTEATEADGERPTENAAVAADPEQDTHTEKSERGAEPDFGSNGIPRQPLRRRKRPHKTAEHGKSPQKEELPLIAEAQSEPIAPLISVSDPPPSRVERNAPDPTACDRHVERTSTARSFGCFSSEDLLLGGLILLLINEGASDDILIILGFLLVTGIEPRH